jgi:hypothetical protein
MKFRLIIAISAFLFAPPVQAQMVGGVAQGLAAGGGFLGTLQRQQELDLQRRALEWQMQHPNSAPIYTPQRSMNCTSYRIGNQVHTDCY